MESIQYGGDAYLKGWDSAVIAHVQGLSFNLIDRRNRAGAMNVDGGVDFPISVRRSLQAWVSRAPSNT